MVLFFGLFSVAPLPGNFSADGLVYNDIAFLNARFCRSYQKPCLLSIISKTYKILNKQPSTFYYIALLNCNYFIVRVCN